MRYNRLGTTGLFVSEMCLGAMTFGGQEGMWATIGGLDQQASTGLVKAAFAGGVNFIDTADVYAGGVSEQMTGQALHDLGIAREEVVLATKAFGPMGEGPNERGASRGHLLRAIDASLVRLQTDHVDLYQIHGWDPATPLEETLDALDTIVRSGRARYVGVSNWAAWQIVKALGIAERRGLQRPVSLQAYYSLVGRGLEREIAPMLLSEGVGLMVWSPLAGGFLSGKYTSESSGEGASEGRRAGFDFPPLDQEAGFGAVDALRVIARARGTSVAQIALAWLLAKRVVTSVIVGARKPEQLADNLGAVDIALGEDELAALDASMPLATEYPGFMLERQGEYRRGQLAGEKPRR